MRAGFYGYGCRFLHRGRAPHERLSRSPAGACGEPDASTRRTSGECELLDNDIGGIAVHIAARICGQAGADDILVSRTVRDLVVGSGTGFEDRGSVELRGVPGTWQLLAVDRHGARAGSAEAELASMPTPDRRTAMRRSDRAVEVMARRTPWIMRGMARLARTTTRS